MKRITGFVLIWIGCIILALISIVWMLFAIIGDSKRAMEIAIGIDQSANAAFGGDNDMSISARCWKNKEDFKYSILVKIIDFIFAMAGDMDHCKTSYDNEMAKQRWQ